MANAADVSFTTGLPFAPRRCDLLLPGSGAPHPPKGQCLHALSLGTSAA